MRNDQTRWPVGCLDWGVWRGHCWEGLKTKLRAPGSEDSVQRAAAPPGTQLRALSSTCPASLEPGSARGTEVPWAEGTRGTLLFPQGHCSLLTIKDQ